MRSRARLDFELARGRPPEAAPALARRAEQLVGRRWRRRLAGGLERLIAAAEAPRPAFSAAVPPRRDEVRAAQPVLEALIVRLRDDAPVQARGVALVSLLLSDGASPAYTPRRPGALGDWAADALRALPAPAHDFSLLA